MDGLLLIDKPAGPTSHDVVARLRRSSRERRIGHTGTLDPAATGLLPLLFGRATRLAALITGGDKTYEAVVRLGFATETDDAAGAALAAADADLPDDAAIHAAIDRFRGEIAQVPPRHSAKHVAGERAYELARRAEPVPLSPVRVVVREIEWQGRAGDLVRLAVTASSGFYVRALARDIGVLLGCGAHLAALRRTRSGPFSVTDAIPLAEAEALGERVVERLVAPADALPQLPAVTATEVGVRRVLHGNPVGPEHLASGWMASLSGAAAIRVLGPDGQLVALAHARGGALHPAVVLG
jgi:tRNA pseudouridine55 synthase